MADLSQTIKTAQEAATAALNEALKASKNENDEIIGSPEASLLQTVVSRLDEAVGAYERYQDYLNPPEEAK